MFLPVFKIFGSYLKFENFILLAKDTTNVASGYVFVVLIFQLKLDFDLVQLLRLSFISLLMEFNKSDIPTSDIHLHTHLASKLVSFWPLFYHLILVHFKPWMLNVFEPVK